MDSFSTNILDWIDKQSLQSTLRFITCGSVDDGKSTLIGRLLWESEHVYDDQIATLKKDSKSYGTQGANIDYALLVDGLEAEREQKITIDVAYRYFSTKNRKFIIADTPGHEEYTRNMVTGASQAELAIILVDAKRGIVKQTRKHAYLAALVGIKDVVLAVNKMDLVDFSETKYLSIQQEFLDISKELEFESIISIPVSGLLGDNITSLSSHTPWYRGVSLIEYLETVEIKNTINDTFILPIQWVNRPDPSFRGYSGTIANGSIYLGDHVRVTSSGQSAHISRITNYDKELTMASSGEAITIELDKEIDISRGDVLTHHQHPIEMSDQFEVTLVWLSQELGLPGRQYEIKLAHQWANVSITKIKRFLELEPDSTKKLDSLSVNDISICNISTNKALSYTEFKNNKTMGSFIIVDKFTKMTVAAGVIHYSLRRAKNIHYHPHSIGKKEREYLNGHKGKVIWFTGLSGSGKSTIANKLEKKLYQQGKHTYLLDGDNIRHGLNKDLGFTDSDRVENIRRIAEVAKLMADAGLIVLTAFISPFRAEREMARELIGPEHFIEVFVDTPLDVCEQRDPKGLYKKARSGEIPNMTGINSPYEKPLNPDVIVYTAKEQVDSIVNGLIDKFFV